MYMLEIEKFIISKGVMGCSLKDIPEHMLSQIPESKVLEIVQHSKNLVFPESLLTKTPDEDCFKLDQVENKDEYDIKFKLEFYRRVVFRATKLHSSAIVRFVQLLIENPDGLTKTQADTLLSTMKKRVNEWTETMSRNKIITVNNGVIKYNTDWIDGTTSLPDDLFTSALYCVTHKQALDLGFIKTKPNRNRCLRDVMYTESGKKRPPTKAQLIQRQIPHVIAGNRLADAEREIKEHDNGVALNVLKRKLNLGYREVNGLVKELKKRDNYCVAKDYRATKVSFLGNLDTSYLEPGMVCYLVDMCTTARITILSELPRDIKKMKNTMNLEKDQFLSILEDHQFKIIEIRSRYIAPEFLIFSSAVNGEDPELLDAFERIKNKILRYFKSKIKGHFLKNVYMNSFDNNYSPIMKQRVLIFYKFINSLLKDQNNYVYLNRSTLLQMSFTSFVRCVPFRSDFQFFKIAFIASKRYDCLKKTLADYTDYGFDDITAIEYENINNKLLDQLDNITVGEILDCFKQGSEQYNAIASKINIYEFDRILNSLVKYNIFEGFLDEDFLYFERIDGIEKYADKVLSQIGDDVNDCCNVNIPYPLRKNFYDQICEFSQDDLYEKAKNLAEATFCGDVRDYFLKKIQSFE